MEEELHGKPGIDQPLFHPGHKTPTVRVFDFVAACGCCVKDAANVWPHNLDPMTGQARPTPEKAPCYDCQERIVFTTMRDRIVHPQAPIVFTFEFPL